MRKVYKTDYVEIYEGTLFNERSVLLVSSSGKAQNISVESWAFEGMFDFIVAFKKLLYSAISWRTDKEEVWKDELKQFKKFGIKWGFEEDIKEIENEFEEEYENYEQKRRV